MFPLISQGQTNSILAEGIWLKMEFTESGVYKITWEKLREMGLEPSEVDPRNLAVYGTSGGMLPQEIGQQLPPGLEEISIVVEGESDGVFNQSDYILFYVDEINESNYNENSEQFEVIKNIYSDKIFYFLTLKNSGGLRIENLPSLGISNPTIQKTSELVYHELDEVNILSSGREWLGEQLNTINTLGFTHTINNILENETVNIFAEFVAQSFIPTKLSLKINNSEIGKLEFSAIPNSQYAIKGNSQANWFEFSSNDISGSTLNLEFEYDQGGTSNSVTYLNKYLIEIPTQATFEGKAKKLRIKPRNSAISTLQIANSQAEVSIWNISNPLKVKSQEFTTNNQSIQFGAFTSEYSEYQIFLVDNLPEPESFLRLQNQNLLGSSPVEFIIISNEAFLEQAERLAAFRRTHDGMSVQVTTTNKIFNEFSAGRQDVSAIRNFIKHKYDQGQALKYVLLFGKGSYDYKNRLENNSNFVPTYESRNSIHPLLTYSSDDFFGFLEEGEGYWEESSSGDHSLDIGVGRIPIKTKDQAKKSVDKIILYQSDTNTLGEWKSKILFVADDGDRNIHQRDANQLATLVDTTHQQFQVRKLFLDSFEQIRLPNGETSQAAEEALIEAVNEGRLIINFTGHGAEFGWMQERVLTFDLMEEWKNTYKLPFLITATCEFGRNDDPTTESGAERLIFKKVGGAIGLLTTTRPVFSSTNYRLNEALYGTMLKQQNGKYKRLGDVIKFTKNNSLQGSLNRNFILLGDPSMKLAYPEKKINITEINGSAPSNSDTLKALQPITIKGEIEEFGNIDNQFNGVLSLTLFDKNQEKTTRGSENDPFEFEERDQVLFKGTATVNSGQFEIQFLIPKNINYSFGPGKIIAYSKEESLNSEALGSTLDFTIGGTHESITTDKSPPQIRVFLNDTLTKITGNYNQDVKVIVKLSDESGINISNAVLGQNLTLTLNDTLDFNLNKKYVSDLDDFRKGTAELNLNNLNSGTNRVQVTARDTHGNSSTIDVEFQVESKSSFITEIKSYPNPFIDETFFSVRHDLLGENLEINVEILNSRGQLVQILEGEVLSAEETLVIDWDGTNKHGQKLKAGIYFYTFRITSNTSGKSDFVRRKLIISN